jgi:hypothetical protein
MLIKIFSLIVVFNKKMYTIMKIGVINSIILVNKSPEVIENHKNKI